MKKYSASLKIRSIKNLPDLIFTLNLQKVAIIILVLFTFISAVLFLRYPYNLNQGIDAPLQEVIIEVEYDGPWIGSITNEGAHSGFSGTRTGSKTIQRPAGQAVWVISASAQKGDGSSNILILRIKSVDDEIIAEKSTYVAYGLVAVSTTMR
jgi:hypothetical protein